MSLERSGEQYAAKNMCTKMADPRREEDVEEGMYVSERNGESDVDDGSLGTRQGDARRCPCGLSLGGTSEREINERKREDDGDQRHGAHTVVGDASFACATDSGSRKKKRWLQRRRKVSGCIQ